MNNFHNTLSKIKEMSKIAEETLATEPVETYRGRLGRKNRAIESLKDLRADYERHLLNSAVFIVVTGEGSADFKELAKGTGCFQASPKSFYDRLVENIPDSLYGREGAASLFDMVTRQLEDVALDLGVISYPQMLFKQEHVREIDTKDKFVSMIQKAINAQVGSELVGLQVIKDLVDVAIDKNHKSKDTPIVLATSDETLAQELKTGLKRLTRRVFLVSASERELNDSDYKLPEVSEESVNKVMKSIKNSVKK